MALPLYEPRLSMITISTWPQRRQQELLDVGPEALAINRAINDTGRGDAIAPQDGEEGHCSPMPMWDVSAQRLAAPIPAVAARHIGLNPGLVDEDRTAGIDASLVQFPPAATPSDVASFLFAGEHGFF
jgi:hypothetical protein